ncbi:hypothetical protein L7F22_019457 [Adiantum nelumboides]|nr:hypothetical protein [Adiantum nelumboides]
MGTGKKSVEVEGREHTSNTNHETSTEQKGRNVTQNHYEAATALSSTFLPSPSRARLTTISPIGSSGLLSPSAKASSTTSDSEFFQKSSDDQQHHSASRSTTALSKEDQSIADLTSSRELELESEKGKSKSDRKVERIDLAEEIPSITVSLNDFSSSQVKTQESSINNEQENAEQKGTSKSPKKPTEAVDFLTKRLRSAIGQEILLQDDDEDEEEVNEDSMLKGSIHVERPAPARSESRDSKSMLGRNGRAEAITKNRKDASTSSSTAWGWSTLTTLPASLRIDQALQSLSFRSESNEGASTPSRSEIQKAKVSSDADAVSAPVSSEVTYATMGSTLGKGFISVVDPRKWFVAEERDAGADVQQTTSKPAQAQSDPPTINRIPTGSFPASSRVASRKKKEREHVNAKVQEMEQATNASIAERERKQAGGKVEEHDLKEERFGIPDEDLERYGGERYPAHEYLILSTAGKPVFWSKISKSRLIRTRQMRQRRRAQQADLESKRAKGEDVSKEAESIQVREERYSKEEQSIQDEEDQMEATRVGLLQAIISNYAENDKKKLYETSAEVLALPKTGKTTFLLRPPLYLIAVSYWDEADSTLRNHLEYLHQAVISLVSASKLNKLFDRAANFDLKRLLQGTDNILDSLLTRLQLETIAMRGALQPLRLNAAIRHDVGAALIPTRSKQSRPQDALYAVLLTRNGIVTLARRRKHSIHPVDCHLLVNTVLSTNALKEGGTQSWVPICLPKFAPQGFLYAHVSFLDDEAKRNKDEKAKDVSTAPASARHPDLGLVLVTANPDGFDDMSAWRDRIVGLLQENKMFKSLLQTARLSKGDKNDAQDDEAVSAAKNSSTTAIRYSADELGIAGLRHFCFKWRSNVQSTSSSYEDPYTPGTDDHRRLLYLYGLAHEYVIKSAKENAKVKKAGASGGSTDASPALSEAESASKSYGKDDGLSSETDDASSVHTTNTSGCKSVESQKQGKGKSTSSNVPVRSSSPPIVPRSVLLSPKAASTSQSPSVASSAADLLKQSMGIGTSQSRSTTSTHVIRTQNEAILAWSTPPFELYICASPHIPNTTLISMAKSVVKWVKQEEHQLFIVSAPIF